MPRETVLLISPKQATQTDLIKTLCAKNLKISENQVNEIRIRKRSIDARKQATKIRLVIDVFVNKEPITPLVPEFYYPPIKTDKRLLIIGCGPAGMFAALEALEKGIKPIIIERGKDVKARRRDLAAINKDRIVDPDSNYCFGEGGAGTYSDGKLYTRSKKRGDVEKVLQLFVKHGANENILYEAHPHIGTNKLPGIVTAIREYIIELGGEIHFNQRVTDFIIEKDEVKAIKTHTGETYTGDALVLATGHSARDIFELLQQKNIEIEAKPFALGVRVEHPQSLIDRIQYKCDVRSEYLPPSAYSLVHQVHGRGVFSFCMCPGGIIAPAATAPGEVVVNGWSPSKRNGEFANSGIVVATEDKDIAPYAKYGALAGMMLQADIEQKAFVMGGSDLTAPAQRLIDFTRRKVSSTLPDTSYIPGVSSVNLHDLLPDAISLRLKKAFVAFGERMKGYYTNEAVLVGVESRTSSPVRIPRDRETLQHPQLKNFYPCGEGAGYAGGIVSAAMDGMACTQRAAEQLLK